MPEADGPHAPARKQLAVLAAILFVAAAYFYQDPEWNGNSRLDLTRAIVEQGALQIDSFHNQPDWYTEDKAFYNGHYYSDKAVGSSLLATPIYFVLHRLGAGLGIALSSSLIKHVLTVAVVGTAFTLAGLCMYLTALRIVAASWRALLPTLAIGFGTMLWPYSAVYYGHVITAALLIAAFYLIFTLDAAPSSRHGARFIGAGFALGLAFITEYPSAVIIAGLLLYAFYRVRKSEGGRMERAVLAGCGGALLPILIVLGYNYLAYGNVIATGYAFEVENRFQEGMALGFMGLHWPNAENTYHITLDPQFGLFWQSPVLLMAGVGVALSVLRRRFRAETFLCVYAIGSTIAMNGGYYLWWGGSAFGPRLLIPALPFFVVPLALVPEGLAWATSTLGLVSVTQMLIPLFGQIQPGNLVYRLHRGMFYLGEAPFRGFSLLWDSGVPQIWRRFSAGNTSWTLGAALGLPYVLSLPLLLIVEGALLAVFMRLAKGEGTAGRRLTATANPGRRDAGERRP